MIAEIDLDLHSFSIHDTLDQSLTSSLPVIRYVGYIFPTEFQIAWVCFMSAVVSLDLCEILSLVIHQLALVSCCHSYTLRGRTKDSWKSPGKASPLTQCQTAGRRASPHYVAFHDRRLSPICFTVCTDVDGVDADGEDGWPEVNRRGQTPPRSVQSPNSSGDSNDVTSESSNWAVKFASWHPIGQGTTDVIAGRFWK